jgi:sialate O-acetylesterase
MKSALSLLILCLSITCGQSDAIAIDLPAVFSSHAVIQMNTELPVWGTADPGTEVTVEFAGQRVTGEADGSGSWMVTLAPIPANAEGQKMVIAGGGQRIVLNDILVGVVWLCGGQSNMEWTVRQSMNAQEEIAAGDLPWLRCIKAPHLLSREPENDIDARWRVSTTKTAGSFTAVGTFLARRLHEELGVPVGLLDVNWGGTRAEPWTEMGSLKRHPRFSQRILNLEAEIRRWGNRSEEEIAALFEKQRQDFEDRASSWWDQKLADDPGRSGNWSAADVDDSEWDTMPVPGLWQGKNSDWDGFVWYRREVEVPSDWQGQDLILEPGAIDDADITYWQGQEVGRTTNQHALRRSYTVPGSLVEEGRAVITIAALDTGGAGGITGDANRVQLKLKNGSADSAISISGDWKIRRGAAFSGDRGPYPPAPPNAPGMTTVDPAVMFNAMLSPFIPYAIEGAVWYQGESNSNEPSEYRELLPLMIGSWRKAWGINFPFGIVQLAAFKAVSDDPVQGGWARLRDAQDFTHRMVRNTGLAVLTDIGDARDIHPINKQDVGRRLADWALNRCHGRSDLPESGPFYLRSKVDGNTMVLEFTHCGDGLVGRRGKPIDGFAIQGQDGRWHWGVAEVSGPMEIRVTHPQVQMPKAVRYAWQDNPVRANVVSSFGLPMAPFKTD